MIIFYTGIGSNKTKQHTENEFLNIMNIEFTRKNWSSEFKIIPREQHYQCYGYKNWILPDDFIFFTLTDRIENSGAEINI